MADYCNSAPFKILAPNNFSNTLFVEELHFCECGIEAILERTFDSIAKTLTTLLLLNNNLKTIILVRFQVFIENANSIRNSFLGIKDGNLECNCEYYFLQSVSAIRYKLATINSFQCAPNAVLTDCPNMQKLQLTTICMPKIYHSREYIDLFWYLKCYIRMKMESKSILISANSTSKFKVIFQLQAKNACSDQSWLRESIKCIQVNNADVEFPNSMFNQSEFVIVSVLYFIHGWPLSVVTIRFADTNKTGPLLDREHFLFISLICFGACILGISITLCRQYLLSNGTNETRYTIDF